MVIIGVAVVTLSVGIYIYCYYSLNTLRGNMPGIAKQFGILIYLIPIILAIIELIMAKWLVLIGILIGWILFKPIINKEFYGSVRNLSLQ